MNANVLFARAQVPMLTGDLEPGDHTLACRVFATAEAGAEPNEPPDAPAAALALLDRIAATDADPWPPMKDMVARMLQENDE